MDRQSVLLNSKPFPMLSNKKLRCSCSRVQYSRYGENDFNSAPQ